MLNWECTPAVLANWLEDWSIWFGAASTNPSRHHVRQMLNFLRLKLDDGWRSELKEVVDWDTVSLKNLQKTMDRIQKKSFPDLKKKINQMQPHQSTETHVNVMKHMEKMVVFGGMGTKQKEIFN